MIADSRIKEIIAILNEQMMLADGITKYDIEIIKNALNKQLQMKVTDVHVDEYYCPNCRSENNCCQGIILNNYCPKCGQHLIKER